MRVEIAICTWNRAELLDKTLANLRNLVIPHDVDWEVLVVNNNCTDATDEVLARHARRLPLRRLFESQPGVSHARNLASANARGDLLLWTDDDVLVDRHWLERYVEAAQSDPSAAFFGGPVEPWFESSPPEWLIEMLKVRGIDGAYAVRRLGDRIVRFDSGNCREMPYGANFAIRTCIQKEYAFDARLGRIQKQTLSGEETTLLQRIIADGHYGSWVPTACVRHFIPQERLNRDFLRRFFIGLGRTNHRAGDPASVLTRWGLWLQVIASDWMFRGLSRTKFHRLSALLMMHGCQVRGWLQESSVARRQSSATVEPIEAVRRLELPASEELRRAA